MNDFGFFPKKEKTSIEELNVVPILDMFVAIVFFLLLSVSMIGMTKIVLPPSSTVSIESNSTKVPLNPKLLVLAKNGEANDIKVILKWEGASPGSQTIEFKDDIFSNQKKAIQEINEMIKKFKAQFPEEKTIQISMQSKIPYQWLISTMDGVREILSDMVLNSYSLADSMRE